MHAHGELIVNAPAELRESFARLKTCPDSPPRELGAVPIRLGWTTRPRPPKMASRSVARLIQDVDAKITQLAGPTPPVAAQTPTRTIGVLAIGTRHAGQLLLTARDHYTNRTEAAFAHLCAAVPIPRIVGPDPPSTTQSLRQANGLSRI